MENDSEDDVNFPLTHNLPPTPAAVMAITTSLETNTRGNHASKETPTTNTRGSHANQSTPAANTRGSHVNQSSPATNTRRSHANQSSPDANTREIQQEDVTKQKKRPHKDEKTSSSN